MIRPPPDCCDLATCPADLCGYGEARCYPPGPFGRRPALRLLGVAATVLALAGTAVPLVPTTPFLLVAAWAFARASPGLERRLREHPRLGPYLTDWERRGAIPRRAKAAAVASLPFSALAVHAAGAGPAVTLAAGLALVCVGGWIVTRPVVSGTLRADNDAASPRRD